MCLCNGGNIIPKNALYENRLKNTLRYITLHQLHGSYSTFRQIQDLYQTFTEKGLMLILLLSSIARLITKPISHTRPQTSPFQTISRQENHYSILKSKTNGPLEKKLHPKEMFQISKAEHTHITTVRQSALKEITMPAMYLMTFTHCFTTFTCPTNET
jgi:hypothetical protein